jgi:O-antigen/teichoic acid export membrane protein
MIARKSFLIIISSLIGQFFNWIEFIIIIKFWGDFAPGALGVIGFTISFLAIFKIIVNLGFVSAHVKRVSEGEDLGTCIGTFAAIKIILTTLMVIIVLIAIFVLKYFTPEKFYDTTTDVIIIILLIRNIISQLYVIPNSTFTSKREIVKQQFPSIIGTLITIPFTILVVSAGISNANISPAFLWPNFLQPLQQFIADHAVESLATTYLISTLVSFLIALWFFRKYPIKRPSWRLFKSYFSFAMPMMIFDIVGKISVNIDKLLIGFFWSTVEVGYYYSMLGVAGIVMIFSRSIGTVLFPTISHHHSNNNYSKIKQLTCLAERYISMITIPLIIGIMVLANPIIRIVLTDSFLPAAPVLFILAIYILLICLDSPYYTLITGMDKPSIVAKIGVFTCVINIVLCYLFIPKNGLLSTFGINGPEGAAVAVTLTLLFEYFLLRIVAKKLTGIKILQSYTIRQIIAGLVMGIILYLLAFHTSFFPIIHWYHLAMFIVLGLLAYFAVLLLLKEFNKNDLYFFLDLLHPKKMLKYISSELKEKPRKPN